MWQEDKKDIARKILPVGFYSRGFVKFSAEDLIYSLKETRGKSFPRELSIVSGKMCEGFKKAAPKLFDAAVNRESDLSYHHPNIFHNDKFYDFKKLNVFKSSCFDEVLADFKNSDYYTLSGKMIDNVVVQAPLSGSIAVWNEVKRHRTILQKAESVYTAVNRAHGELNSLKKGETPEWIHIPPGCGNEYVDAVYESLCEYQNLKDRFGEAAAIYVVPHCVKLKFNLTMNGYHLLHPFGFFGVRECSTADYEIRDIARKLHSEIEEKIPELKGKIGPKCKTAVCPERQSCGFVERYRVKT
jgi:hypothetical protein